MLSDAEDISLDPEGFVHDEYKEHVEDDVEDDASEKDASTASTKKPKAKAKSKKAFHRM